MKGTGTAYWDCGMLFLFVTIILIIPPLTIHSTLSSV